MRVALCTVCPDRRQQAQLDVVWPTWEAFSRRHNLPLQVIEDDHRPDAFYWAKYLPLTLPQLKQYDAVLCLDNDVVIAPDAPSPVEGWDGSRVRCVDEGDQFPHSLSRFADYYGRHDLILPAGVPQRIFNTGVLLYTREHAVWLEEVYQGWRRWRENFLRRRGPKVDPFVLAGDQPHVSHALLCTGRYEEIDVRFNRLWWSWWEEARRPELPLLLYAKFVQLLGRVFPRALLRPLARPGGSWWDAALRDAHFVHAAGSKSPLALFEFGAKSRPRA